MSEEVETTIGTTPFPAPPTPDGVDPTPEDSGYLPASESSNPSLSSSDIEKLREKAKSNLYFFIKGVLGKDWLNPRIHGPICKNLEDETKLNQLIVLPRGWQKTTIILGYMLWMAIRHPNIRIMYAQKTQTNADSQLKVLRLEIERNEILGFLFPELKPNENCAWTQKSLVIGSRTQPFAQGTFDSVGTQGGITGRHYDIFIEDDTVAPDLDDLSEAHVMPSQEDISQSIGYHQLSTAILEGGSPGINIVIGTRWADRDLISYIQKNEGKYFTIYYRGVRETDGKPDPSGEVTYPERFPLDKLEFIEVKMGRYLYACNYLNLPMDSASLIFKESWITEYETHERDLAIYTSVDLASDPNDVTSDDPDFFTVITTGKSLISGRIYVLEITRERCNPSEQVHHIFEHVRRWKPIKVGIGAVQYETTIKHWCEERMRKQGLFFVIELLKLGTSSGQKKSRIMGLEPLFSSKTIVILHHMKVLKQELLVFPFGNHDDVIDCLSMQLGMWQLMRVEKKEDYYPEGGIASFDQAVEDITKERERRREEVIFIDYLEGKNDEVYNLN